MPLSPLGSGQRETLARPVGEEDVAVELGLDLSEHQFVGLGQRGA